MATLNEVLKRHELLDIESQMKDAHIAIDNLKWMNVTDHCNDFNSLAKELNLNTLQKIKLRSLICQIQHESNINLEQDSSLKSYEEINLISMKLENEIKLKFQEIITKLQHQQNDLLLQIQKWKISAMQRSNPYVIEPKIEFKSFIDLNDISSFIDFNVNMKTNKEDKEQKDQFMDIIKANDDRNKFNPFSDEYEPQEIIGMNKLKDIQLKYLNHRKHFINENNNDNEDKYHPKQLLDLYNNDKYYSDKIGNFEENENDWIIFQTLYENQYFIPKVLQIKNHSNEYAVKKLKIFIGNNETNEWFNLTENEALLISNKNMFFESINLKLNQGINDEMIKTKKWNCFKIELIDNYGANAMDKSKFCLHYFALQGQQIDDTNPTLGQL